MFFVALFDVAMRCGRESVFQFALARKKEPSHQARVALKINDGFNLDGGDVIIKEGIECVTVKKVS